MTARETGWDTASALSNSKMLDRWAFWTLEAAPRAGCHAGKTSAQHDASCDWVEAVDTTPSPDVVSLHFRGAGYGIDACLYCLEPGRDRAAARRNWWMPLIAQYAAHAVATE